MGFSNVAAEAVGTGLTASKLRCMYLSTFTLLHVTSLDNTLKEIGRAGYRTFPLGQKVTLCDGLRSKHGTTKRLLSTSHAIFLLRG